ncbi:MAG: branched-chain amino acid transporter AzlC [Thermoplasmata archaeon]|nr:branched-chain amino acid transporter AzlC [Thermoplasmata archaeon]
MTVQTLEIKGSLFSAAFKTTIPVLAGYLGLGLAFGIMLEDLGYNALWAAFFSLVAYGGTIQYLAIALLSTVFNPLEALFLSVLVNFRHLFYGITMAEKFRGVGKKKLALIFGLSDETFSLLSTTELPEGTDRGKFYLYVTLLDHSYWILGSFLGGIAGSLISFNTAGISFVLTALFVVLFMEQLKNRSNIIPGIIGLGATLISLLFFGDNLIIPAMALIMVAMLAMRRYDVLRH